jgi:CBS domain-containing protein
MQVHEIMTRNPEIVEPDATLRDAARKMKELDVGSLPVGWVDDLSGIITDRDIAVRAVAEGRDPQRTKVSEIMTHGVVTVREDDDIRNAISKMREQQIRRVVVTDRDERPIGMLSLGDIAVDIDDENIIGELLDRISRPSQPNR